MSRQRILKLIISLCILIVLSALGIGVNETSRVTPKLSPTTPPGTYQVVKVDDGDTIVVKVAGHNETVRMIGIDTPEVKDPRKPVQCFGQVASAETHKLLDGKTVRLETDSETSDRDKYHRLLRYVYAPDGTFINQYLVQQGYAFAYVVFPNSKLDQFRAWEREAREHNRGLWAGCQVNADTDIKQTQGQ